MIPKIIHQTAKTKDLTWSESQLVKRARKLMSDYEYHLWDDNDNEKIIQEYFPQYHAKYNSISKGVAKADIARITYMYVFGGWYFDTDYKFIKSIPNFLNERKVILPISRNLDDGTKLLGNCIFASEPKLEFWKDFLAKVFKSNELSNLNENRVEEVTGPQSLTEFYNLKKEKYPYLDLLEKDFFHPLLKGFSAKTTLNTLGMHLCFGSWRTGKFNDRIINFAKRTICPLI